MSENYQIPLDKETQQSVNTVKRILKYLLWGIIIIFIFAALIIAYFVVSTGGDTAKKKRDAIRKVHVVNIVTHTFNYAFDNQVSPKTIEELDAAVEGGLPKDPLTNQHYYIDLDGSDGKTEVCADLELEPRICQPLQF